MPQSNKVQTRFHGGEWSKDAQGRIDDPRYSTAMNLCYNAVITKAGPWTRRGGTRLMIPTYKGRPGKVQPLAMEATASYSVEFTDLNMRFFHGALPVATNELNNVLNISTANPAIMTVAVPVSWATGDEVLIWFTDMAGGDTVKQCPELRQRIVTVTPIPLVISGAWDIGTTYAQNAGVTFDGVTYIAVVGSNTGNQPDESPTFWMPLAGTSGAVQFSLHDSITGAAIDGSGFVFIQDQIYALRLQRLAAPWTAAQLPTNRIVQQQDNSFILNGAVRPQILKITPNAGTAVFADATLKPVFMQDGPYLDPVANSVMTVGGLSGNVAITVQFQQYDAGKTYAQDEYVSDSSIGYISLADVNVGNTPASSPSFWAAVALGTEVTGPDWTGVPGFTSGDVGRHVRLFSQPDLWVAGSYTAGDFVLYNNVVYQAETNNSKQPDTSSDDWNVIPSGQRWCWAKVTSVTGPTTCNIQIIGQDLLYNTDIRIWRLGVYSDAAGWPTCGTFHEGRLWLGGVVKNRLDGSMVAVAQVGQGGLSAMSNPLVCFSPTLDDGTVADNCGIAYTLDAQDKNNLLWMNPEEKGIACGTINGEWMVQATQLSDPLTPTSIQAHRVTKYGCANIEPRRTGIALVFVQKFARRCMEFISDVYSGKHVAPDLNEYAEHITQSGVVEIAYQEELAPVLWARLGNGTFAGTTYRRTNPSVIQPPDINGWGRHALAGSRTLESLIVGPSADATLDTVTMVTNGADAYALTGGTRYVEMMTDLFEQDTPIYDAWHVDCGLVPASMYEDTNVVLGVYFTGMWYLRGKTVAVFAGGLDVGDKVVDSQGRVFVPYGDGVQPTQIDYTTAGAGAYAFTQAYVASLRSQNVIPRNGGIISSGQDPITITTGTGTIPSVTKIQTYIPTNAFGTEVLPVGQSTNGMMPNVVGDMVTYYSEGGQGSNAGFRTFNITSGAQLSFKTFKNMGSDPPGTGARPLLDIATVDFENNITYIASSSGYGVITVVKQSDLSKISITGTDANNGLGGGALNPISLQSFGSATSAFGKLGPWVASSALTGLARVGMIQNHVSAVDVFSFAESGASGFISAISSDVLMGFHALTSFSGSSAGPVGYYGQFVTIQNQVDAVYLGQHASMDSKKGKGKKKFQLNQTDIFRGGNSGSITAALTRIGDVTPAMIDPSWTHFTQEGGLITDQLDNGTLAFFATNDAIAPNWSGATTYAVDDYVIASDGYVYKSLVAGNLNHNPSGFNNLTQWVYSTDRQTKWLIKLAKKTNTILWRVPVANTGTQDDCMARSKISGVYIFVSPSQDVNSDYPVYVVNTQTGKYFVGKLHSAAVSGFSGNQVCDSNSYSIFLALAHYDSASPGAPTGLNSTVSFDVPATQSRLFIGQDLAQHTGFPSTGPLPVPKPVISITVNPEGQFPCVIGTPFTSQGQMLRAATPDDVKSPVGPGLAKTRRSHYLGLLLRSAVGVKIGTDLTTMVKVTLKTPGNKQYTPLQMFSGVTREDLFDGYSFDSMPAWEVSRPYPLSVVSAGPFLKTQE